MWSSNDNRSEYAADHVKVFWLRLVQMVLYRIPTHLAPTLQTLSLVPTTSFAFSRNLSMSNNNYNRSPFLNTEYHLLASSSEFVHERVKVVGALQSMVQPWEDTTQPTGTSPSLQDKV